MDKETNEQRQADLVDVAWARGAVAAMLREIGRALREDSRARRAAARRLARAGR